MTTRRFQLDGETLEGLREQIRREYGAAARIVSVEKVTVGGIAGFLARHRYEATVEVDGPATQSGIAALIANAEEAEAEVPGAYEVSTSGTSFETVMQSLRAQTSDASPAPAAANTPSAAGMAGAASASSLQRTVEPALPSFGPLPAIAAASEPAVAPLTAPGDLIVFVGLGADALEPARATGGVLAACGAASARGIRSLDDRRSAFLARADAVTADTPVALAWGLSGALASAAELHGLAALQPDQVFVVVDATRKHEDTAAWVAVVEQTIGIDAMLVTHEEQTATPESVHRLGVPLGRL